MTNTQEFHASSRRLGHATAIGAATMIALAALGACASIQVGVDHEPGVRLDNNPFFDSRVRAAVELELATKGLRFVTGAPDLMVHYHSSVRQRVDVIRRERSHRQPPGDGKRIRESVQKMISYLPRTP